MNPPSVELEQRFSDWQVGLVTMPRRVNTHVAERQQALYEAVDSGPVVLARHLRTELGIPETEAIDAPTLPTMLSASEFRNPTFEYERKLAPDWAGRILPREAAQPLFWTRCHIDWLERGYLSNKTDEALTGKLTSGAREDSTENGARNLLRRLGGLPVVRGKRSVLMDCPLSRAWWRNRLAQHIAASSDGKFTADAAHRVLHASNDAWARLVGDAVDRITVMNSSRARGALLYQYRDASRDVGGIAPLELQRAARAMAREGVALTFDVLDWSELLDLAAAAVEQAKAEMAEEERQKAEEQARAKAAESVDKRLVATAKQAGTSAASVISGIT